jgi:hypothetical protein
VLQVRHSGGFVPVGFDFRSVPAVSAYGDGRVVLPGAETAVFPGPALPSVQVGQLDPEQVRRLVEDGREAVDPGGDPGQRPIADAPTTVVAVGHGEGREIAAVPALAEAGALPTQGLTPEQQEARERLSAYLEQVQEVVRPVETQPHEAKALAVLAMPYGDVSGTGLDERPWPGPPLAEGEPSGTGRCLVVTERLDAVLEAAAQASQETVWTSGDERWRLALRPLLPSEGTCDDVMTGPRAAAP